MDASWPTGNPQVKMTALDVLSDNWYVLRKATFEYLDAAGNWTTQIREAYDRGNGATVLMVDWDRRTVLLTRQFRVPAYLNEHHDGMLIETPAGLLDDDDPLTAAMREAEEETGYRPRNPQQIFELFMSPGSVTERVGLFAAEYDETDRIDAGGGVEAEGEDIEVLELGFAEAVEMIATGEIMDGKTVLLLQWLQLEDHRRAASANSAPTTSDG